MTRELAKKFDGLFQDTHHLSQDALLIILIAMIRQSLLS